MNKYLFFIFISLSFALLIASPGRFVFGTVICLELILLVCISFLLSFISKKLKLDEFENIICICGLVFFAILYKQFLMLLFPVIALQLSFVVFLPVVTSYVIGITSDKFNDTLKASFAKNIKFTLLFCLYAIFVYVLRDILGYGTITLFANGGFREVVLFTDSIPWCAFFASIPGALFIVSVSILLFLIVENKFKIIERAGIIDVSR